MFFLESPEFNCALRAESSGPAPAGGAGLDKAPIKDTDAIVFAALYERKIALLFTFPKADLSVDDHSKLDEAVCLNLSRALWGPASEGGLDSDNLFGRGAREPAGQRTGEMKQQLGAAGVTMEALGPAHIKAELLARGGVPDAVRYYVSK